MGKIMDRRAVFWLALFVLVATLSGCAAGMATRVEESVTPPEPVPVERLAVMPVTTEAGSQGLRPGVARTLYDALQRAFPELWIVGPEEAGAVLARSSVAREYARLLDDYERTGVVESARLAGVTRALEVDHFLQVRVEYRREDFVDNYLWEDELTTEDRQIVVLVARLWTDRGTGPVWEAAVRTTSDTDEFQKRRRRMDELIAEVVGGMTDRIPVRGAP